MEYLSQDYKVCKKKDVKFGSTKSSRYCKIIEGLEALKEEECMQIPLREGEDILKKLRSYRNLISNLTHNGFLTRNYLIAPAEDLKSIFMMLKIKKDKPRRK